MTKKEFRKSIKERISHYKKDYSETVRELKRQRKEELKRYEKSVVSEEETLKPIVEINRSLPYIAVNCFDFFSQGDDAMELIKDADEGAEKFGISPEDYLLFYLDSCGVC